MQKYSDNRNRPLYDLVFVALSLSRLPMLALIIEFCVLMLVPQAQEILFGLESPILELGVNASARKGGDWMSFVLFVIATILLALSVWYCSRLLSSVHQLRVMPRDVVEEHALPDSMVCAITWVPRCLGTLSIGLAVGSLLMAGVTQNSNARSPMALCLLMPLALAVYAQVLLDRYARPRLAAIVTAAFVVNSTILMLIYPVSDTVQAWVLFYCLPVCGVMGWTWYRKQWNLASSIGAFGTLIANVLALLVAAGIPITAFLPFAILCVTALLPALFHMFVVRRRTLLAWLHQRGPAWVKPAHPLGAARSRTLSEVRTVLFIGVMISVAMLLLLRDERPWLRSSATVVLLFLSSMNFALTTVALVYRRLLPWRPGLVWAPALLFVAVLANNRESIGEEEFHATSGAVLPSSRSRPSEQIEPARRVVVNAHGGGLRAAYFTAQVLARLDDFSCGRFGERLTTTSGVSGGSLGLATYLLARQHFVTHGDALGNTGWTRCSDEQPPDFPLSRLVDSLLINDHLSGVVSTMLTSDLFPGDARRGQSLLNSWQRPYLEKLQSGVSLAMPLSAVTAGRPRIDSYFNATDARTGEGVALSNRYAETSLLPIGLAVLHSARFPVVSPAGRWQPDGGRERLLVDGGYSDNSGAAQLSRAVSRESFGIWLNIDGNPTEGECASATARPDHWMNWTGADALLASRRQRSAEAERQMQARVDEVGAKHRRITLSMPQAYASMKTVEDRCQAARHHRTAPLGWYMSSVTAWDMRFAALAAAASTCKEFSDLCRR
ncbi:hypothetical protein O987_08910 [Comamonas testosteroni TK102]|uniref:PNPLA domain-containing protein n=1 Tax=Comamonas testosteroni TK102 TaxID=1392005 RepID=A0A076PRC4_COMTE|nr:MULTISPECIES: patatin-like phospholipase family protein [Comamonas]AIJ45917.1 hypothetical protein O987_08910 [Comamonas testosteroni TK102]MPS87211.1 patatin-like phospholipase family protein [Comamonas sp.]